MPKVIVIADTYDGETKYFCPFENIGEAFRWAHSKFDNDETIRNWYLVQLFLTAKRTNGETKMNNSTRKALRALSSRVDDIRAQLEDIASVLETHRDNEQEKFDNMSEGMQESERGQSIMEAAENLDSAFAEIESAIGTIDDAIIHLSAATGE